ncbi:hypothetical protein V8J82_16045 [Gymnodinialimonas sp. 2305UL16-5]|uniref:hypothetical protein n=1 Tax=Gymnodinialimonas mytili TaxID=3126503 RepID=UPI0030951604
MTNKTPDASNFSLYLIFSEGLQFTTSQIQTALLEDFPDLDIDVTQNMDFPAACDTDQAIPMAPILMGARGADAIMVNMMRLPGYGIWDPKAVQPRQLLACADYDLKGALTRNRSYLCVSVDAKSNTLEDRFRAARLASCVGALFAELPICLGAYWEPADHFLSPQGVREMAQTAMEDGWPVRSWVGVSLASLQAADPRGRPWSTGSTLGLRYFTGYEMQLVAAPYDLDRSCSTLWGMAWLPLVSGNQFAEGHTIGDEGGAEEDKLRLRWLPKGATSKRVKSDPLPFDTFIAIHPESPFDEAAYFGKRWGRSRRKQVITQAPRPNFFKRMMGRGHA